jgi:putative endopeptidase
MNLRRAVVVLCFCCLLGVSVALILSAGFTAKAAGDTASWGFSMKNLDTTCKPCDDFYQYAMGGWMKSNPIPPEYPSWGTFTELRDKNLTAMRTILDSSAKAHAAAGSNEQKIGDFYSTCMDTSVIDAAKLTPLKPELAKIDAIQNTNDLQAPLRTRIAWRLIRALSLGLRRISKTAHA